MNDIREDQLFRNAQTFVEQVYNIGSWKGEFEPATSLSIRGAEAMSKLVMSHPIIANGSKPEAQLRLFGPTDDPKLEALRGQSVGYLVAGTLALSMTGFNLEELAPDLVLAAAAIDPESLLLRQSLLGERPYGPPTPIIPDWVDDIKQFVERNCFAGVIKAVIELGGWAMDKSTSDATGITGLSATIVCQGGPLTIYGSGFGATQPSDTRVYVPVRGGGCREAKVTQWSDTAIVIDMPTDIGTGCVGFVRGNGQYHEPQQVTGELTTCIGAAAEIWTKGFSRVNTPIVTCPPCLPGGQNHIQEAGSPTINSFRISPYEVEPNGQPVLSWNVSNATTIQILSPIALVLPNPLPPIGSITLPPIGGLVPVSGMYRIIASNACGRVYADAEFLMTRRPKLSITRIEVVQSIQKVDNSVRLTAQRRTAVRVFVDSGITDGFDFGLGPNRVGGLRASLYAEDLATGSMRNCGNPWSASVEATPTPNRDLLDDSINFDVPLNACNGNVRFYAVVEQPGPIGQPPTAWTSGSVDVSFTPKQAQELLPLLIMDPTSASPAPTMADFMVNISGPATAQPFRENGFVINPPLVLSLLPGESLKVGIMWQILVARISTMAILFPQTPVGGIRAAIVPNDPAYPWGGMALPRVAVTIPSFIAIAGNPTVTTHELAHAYGLMHVDCGGPAGPFDGRLPFTISDPGINVPARTILPTGTNEAMTYCFPQWPSIEHWDAIFDRIPV